MPTIIDSLVVRLGLDTTDYDKAAPKVKKGLDDTEATAKKQALAFNAAARGALQFLAVLGSSASFAAFVQHTIESNSALQRFAQNIGLASSEISALSNAAELAGGSGEGLARTLDHISQEQTRLQLTGQSGLIPYFSMLGVAMSDAGGHARSTVDILLDLADRFSRIDRRTAYNVGRAMGIDPSTLQLLMQGRDAVQRYVAQQESGLAVSKQEAEQAEQLRQRLTYLKQEYIAVGRSVMTGLLPVMEPLLHLFENLGEFLTRNRETITEWSKYVGIAVGGVLAVFNPLAAVVAAIVDDFLTWANGGESLIPWDKLVAGAKKFWEALGPVRETLAHILSAAMHAGAALFDLVTGDFEGAQREGARALQSWHGAEASQTHTGDAGLARGEQSKPLESRREAAVRYFMSKGYTREQALGLVANFERESNINPTAEGDNGQAYGIAQWHPDRQAQFKKLFGHDIRQSTLEEQLEFAAWELSHTESRAGEALKSSRTAGQAARAVSMLYERPRGGETEANYRGMLANTLADTPLGLAQAVQASNVTNAPVSNTVQTNIGQITVQVPSGDPNTIAAGIAPALDYTLTAQANAGLR